jgi:hypothetical protein
VPAASILAAFFGTDRMEELTVQRLLPVGITVTEIPFAQRVVEAPERFGLTLTNGGMPPWRLEFHDSSFEET